MSPMVERVARALCVARLRDPDQELTILTGPKGGTSQARWLFHVSEARDAMTAMKYVDGTDEPNLITVSNEERVEAVSLIMAWDALIDAALADGAS